MKKFGIIIWLFSIVLLFIPSCFTNRQHQSTTDPAGWLLANKLKMNVVQISANNKNGMGFILGEDIREEKDILYIATAAHVVSGCLRPKNNNSILITFMNKTKSAASILPRDIKDVDDIKRCEEANISNDWIILKAQRPHDFDWVENFVVEEIDKSIEDKYIWIVHNGWNTTKTKLSGVVDKIDVDQNIVKVNVKENLATGESGTPLISEKGAIGLFSCSGNREISGPTLTRIRQYCEESKIPFGYSASYIKFENIKPSSVTIEIKSLDDDTDWERINDYSLAKYKPGKYKIKIAADSYCTVKKKIKLTKRDTTKISNINLCKKKWYYLAGGAVVVGGISYLLTNSGGHDGAEPQNGSTIQLPPGRPDG